MTYPTYQIIDKSGALVLDINDSVTYATQDHGLFDMPDAEAILSPGYASGSVFLDSRDLPRAITLNIDILAGSTVYPVRNATYNAARDALIKAIPRGKLIILRTEYLGTAGYWDIPCFVQNLQEQRGTRTYVATLSAPDPDLIHNTIDTTGALSVPTVTGNITSITPQVGGADAGKMHVVFALAHSLAIGDTIRIQGTTGTLNNDPNNKYHIVRTVVNSTQVNLESAVTTGTNTGGTYSIPQITATVAVGGNTDTTPTVLITPITQKVNRWRYMTRYTVTNNANTQLFSYPVRLPFDIWSKVSGGKVKGSGGDIRVVANGLLLDRFWLGSISSSTTYLWVELDLPPSSSVTVDVLYGYTSIPDAQDWANRKGGPIFDLADSLNTAWQYDGAFMDPPGAPSLYSWQWSLHVAQAIGFTAVRRHLTSPWRSAAAPRNTLVNAAGAEIQAAVQVQGYAGIAIHHPLKIASVVHQGRYLLDVTQAKFTVHAFNDLTASLEDYDVSLATVGSETAYGPMTLDVPDDTEAIVFALRSLSVHQGNPGWIGAADLVTLNFTTPVTVVADAEAAIFMLEAQIENQTTGHQIRLFGYVTEFSPGVWNTVTLDCENQLVTMGSAPFYYAWTMIPPIRANWMLLAAGNNVLRLRDEGAESTRFEVRNQARRL